MTCKFCWKEIPEGSVVCPFCATSVNKNIDNNQNVSNHNANNESISNQNTNSQNTNSQNTNSQNTSVQQYAIQNKSKLAAGLLGIFLGTFGIHNFYLGYNTKAIIQLCITLLTCGFGAIITAIWGFIEGIMILSGSIKVDGYGNPLVETASPVVVNQYNGNVINNVGNYNNDFKVKINEKKEDGKNTIIVGDVVLGSISVGENARIEDITTHEFINRKIISIEEEGMNVSFSMDKNIVIRIEGIDINNTGNELIK